MSLREPHRIKCNNCGEKFEINEWNSINIAELPELKEQVITGDIFDFTCEHCNVKYKILHDCLYYDKDNQFILQLLPAFKEEEYIFSGEEQTIISSFGENILRLTSDYLPFIEKVRVLSCGLNDKAIEICKTVAFINCADKSKGLGVQNIFYFKNTDDEIIYRIMNEENEKIYASIGMDFYNKVLRALKGSKIGKEYRDRFKKIEMNWAFSKEVEELLESIEK